MDKLTKIWNVFKNIYLLVAGVLMYMFVGWMIIEAIKTVI